MEGHSVYKWKLSKPKISKIIRVTKLPNLEALAVFAGRLQRIDAVKPLGCNAHSRQENTGSLERDDIL